MFPTPRCLAPGFLSRSVSELKRLTGRALKAEGVTVPTKPFPLISFEKFDDLEKCKRMSDKDLGGFSTVNLDFHPETADEPSHARFHGTISTELPRDQLNVYRTGYAAWRTKDQGRSIFGKMAWDVEAYNYMAVHFKSDGRKYFINVQTDNVVPTDIHQHRLYAKTPGEWETVLIKFSEFVRTNHGEPVQPQRAMLTQRMLTVGIGLIDRIPGPYDLCISRIWATNAGKQDPFLSSVRGTITGLPLRTGARAMKRPHQSPEMY